MVEGTALEKRHTRKGIEGSNPSLSEFKKLPALGGEFFHNLVSFR